MTIHSIQDGIPARARRETRRIAKAIANLQAMDRHEEASALSHDMIMKLPIELVPLVMQHFRETLEAERRKLGLC